MYPFLSPKLMRDKHFGVLRDQSNAEMTMLRLSDEYKKKKKLKIKWKRIWNENKKCNSILSGDFYGTRRIL